MHENYNNEITGVVLLGLPGSGKGTQSTILERRFNMCLLSTGNMLRALEKGENVPPSMQHIKQTLSEGRLVDDDLVISMVRSAVMANNDKNSFLFDGFPRTVNQARALSKIMAAVDGAIGVVFVLSIDPSTLLRRLSGRLLCSSCNAIFNTESKPPVEEGICDYCGAQLVHRSDDDASVSERRIMTMQKGMDDLVTHYISVGVPVVRIIADRPIDEVSAELCDKLSAIFS